MPLLKSTYHLLPDSETENGSNSATKRLSSSTSRSRQAFQIIACLFIISISFIAGTFFERIRTETSCKQNTPSISKSGDTVPVVNLEYTVQHFELDPAFATIPNNTGKAEPAWDSLIPNGLGYVKHPDMAPELSVVSAFHQLHCLYTLRRAYFADKQGPLQDFDFGLDRAPHAIHCFEYLRQSLMCSADSSVEPAEKAKDGVEFLGWGFGRQCRDYESLKAWAEKWRAFDAHGFLAKDLHKHGVGGHEH